MGGKGQPGDHDRIEGLEQLDKLIAIDQSPIGRTPRSNPGTYIKVFDDIRDLYTQLPESKRRGYKPGRFSFNVRRRPLRSVRGQRLEPAGNGFPGRRLGHLPRLQGPSLQSRNAASACSRTRASPTCWRWTCSRRSSTSKTSRTIHHKLSTLHDVGLDYIKLGQPSPTLSGGEAQRIKLARELVKKRTGRTLYLLDEPTTGLHFADIELLLKVLHDFVDAGNTVLVVEHNLDVVKTADWIIDIGPEGGAGGGRIVACGTPEEVAQNRRVAHRPRARAAAGHPRRSRKRAAKPQAAAASEERTASRREATHITVRGARQHNLEGRRRRRSRATR